MLKTLTDQEIDRLVKAPDWRSKQGKRDRALLNILAFGGLRIAEACSLRILDIERDGDRMRLTFAGKGGRVRTVSLPQRAQEAILSYLTPKLMYSSHFLFPGRNGPLAVRSGRQIVDKYAQLAELPDWVHPHSLRHSYGTKLMRETGDLFLVSRVLGHASPNTTAKYYLAYDPSYADRAAAVWS